MFRFEFSERNEEKKIHNTKSEYINQHYIISTDILTRWYQRIKKMHMPIVLQCN